MRSTPSSFASVLRARGDPRAAARPARAGLPRRAPRGSRSRATRRRRTGAPRAPSRRSSSCAPRSVAKRATSLRVEDPRRPRVAQLRRLEARRAARNAPSSAFALRIRSSRNDRSPSLVRSHVWTYQFGSSRPNEYGSTSRVDGSESASFWYSISTSRSLAHAARERRDEVDLLGRRRAAPASARARTGRTSPRASCGRARGACARRPRSSGRRTRARAGSRAPRAASGAAPRGTCRPRAPCRRGPTPSLQLRVDRVAAAAEVDEVEQGEVLLELVGRDRRGSARAAPSPGSRPSRSSPHAARR